MTRFHAHRWLIAAVLLTALGCAPKSDAPATTDTANESPTPSSDAVAVPPEQATSGWQRIQQGESELAGIIEAGQMNQVHDKIAAIQASLVDAASVGASLPREERGEFDARLAGVVKIADTLHEAADAGDLTKTKAEFERFRTELRAIEGLLGAAGQ